MSVAKQAPWAVAAIWLGLIPLPGLAFDSGSTGADGAFTPTVHTELQLPPSGVFNFTAVDIPSGVTVTFRPNATNTPLVMLVQGDAVIAGIIQVNGGASPSTGRAGDGNLTDDGGPGRAGPGGFNGGAGGPPPQGPAGRGLGPGGGQGAVYVAGSYAPCTYGVGGAADTVRPDQPVTLAAPERVQRLRLKEAPLTVQVHYCPY